MRPNLSSLVILLSACIAGAAPAPYPIDVNSRAQSAPAVTCYRANAFTIRATYLDGQTASDLTGAIPFLSWATNTTAASVSTSSWAFVGSPTNGIVDFTFAPAAVNFTPGRYIYEVGVKTSNSVVSVYRQGIFFIVGSPTAAGVGAVDWTTSLNWDLIDWTNLPSYISSESDPVAYPVATNALAVAEGALQTEADTLATVTARGATTESSMEVNGLTAKKIRIVEDTGSTVGGYSILVGSGIAYGDYSLTVGNANESHGLASVTVGNGAINSNAVEFVFAGANGVKPIYYNGHGNGTFNINPVGGLAGFWIGETNMAATLSGYATTGAVAAVQAEVAGKADAETVVTGAVGTASAGNRYFWTSATNVVLSVNLTSGQVVNLAKLNNTATNSIKAIGQVGWEWTGGDMTNTIPAGKSMTFGFLIDAATGKTNAYATGVSK